MSLQGRLGQFGGGEQASSVILGPLLSALLRETKELEKVGFGYSSPGCTLTWGEANALPTPSFPIGYFLADTADMLWNQTLGQAWELLCHHLVVRLGERQDRKGGVPRLKPQSLISLMFYDFPESH